MSATDHINAAARLLDHNGLENTPDPKVRESVAHARIALALAVQDLTAATQQDSDIAQSEWPAGVTARILTRLGMRSRQFIDATVDIHDDQPGSDFARSTARCRPCGWTKEHGLVYRNSEVLPEAHEHAAVCTALPAPTA